MNPPTVYMTFPKTLAEWLHLISGTYTKQIETWNGINNDVPTNTKYQDFVDSLKINNEIEDLPWYVAGHILTVIEKKQNQQVKKVLELLDLMCGRSRLEQIIECVQD